MFNIDSLTMSPNHDNLRQTILESMRDGVQLQNLDTLSEICRESMGEMAQKLANDWYITNPNSPESIVKFLVSCDIPEVHQACCENGKWSSKAEGLKILAQQGFQFAVDILTYRKAKSYSQAVESLKRLALSNGRVYPTVGVLKTNRISYSEPALMSIPKALLWSVIAPRTPNTTLVSVDIHQQEPLILINMLDIEPLKALAEDHEDIYRALFTMLFGSDCTERERAEFKMCWNATSYGASKKSLVERCRFIDGGAVYTFMHQFKELDKYIGSSYAKAKRDIQRTETYFGTELYADKAGSALRRSLLDLPIQGTGADILAFLIEHFQEEMSARDLEQDVRLYYSRHDECVLEVNNNLLEEDGQEGIESMLKEVFTHQVDDWVPFQVEVEFHEPDHDLLSSSEAILQRCREESFAESEE